MKKHLVVILEGKYGKERAKAASAMEEIKKEILLLIKNKQPIILRKDAMIKEENVKLADVGSDSKTDPDAIKFTIETELDINQFAETLVYFDLKGRITLGDYIKSGMITVFCFPISDVGRMRSNVILLDMEKGAVKVKRLNQW